MPVITLDTVTPPVRHDALPFTTARIEEAPLTSDSWTTIDTFTLDPVDADPASPQPRSLTSEAATLTYGRYRVVFVDADGDESRPSEVIIGDGIGPSVDAVAALVPTYTVAAYGAPGSGTELGTFTNDTSPTRAQVEQLIAQAVGDLTARIGEQIPPEWRNEARRLVALRAAALVIASRAGEEYVEAAARHPYMAMYLAGLESLAGNAASAGTSPMHAHSVPTSTTVAAASTAWDCCELLP